MDGSLRNALLALVLALVWAFGCAVVVTSCNQEPEHGVFDTSGDGDGDGDGDADGGAGQNDAGPDGGGDAGDDAGVDANDDEQ